jgi:hypothetical protein
MAQEELVHRRGAALAPDVLVREQYREPLGTLGVPAGRMKPRERRMRQDVDNAPTR